MSATYKINGRAVSKEEWDASLRKSSKLDEMFAARKAPGIRTDSNLFTSSEQRRTVGGGVMRDHYVTQAKKHGYTPDENDVYCPTLADFPGDPKAFIRPGEGRSHIRKVCEAKGVPCEGAVTVGEQDRKPKLKGKKLADDLADQVVDEWVKEDPKLAKESRTDLRQEAANKHGRKRKTT